MYVALFVAYVVSHCFLLNLVLSCPRQIKANTITSVVEVLLCSLYMQNRVSQVTFSNAQQINFIVHLVFIVSDSMPSGDEGETARVFLHNVKEQQNFCGLFSPLQVVYISEDPTMFLTRFAVPLFKITGLFMNNYEML